MKRTTKFVPSRFIFDWVESQLMIDNQTRANKVHKTIFTRGRH